MNGVPLRAFLLSSALPRIIVPEPIHDDVPDRSILGDQHLFGQADPDGVEDKPSASEIRHTKISSATDGLGMLGDPLIE